MFDRGKSRLLALLFGTKGNIGKLPFIDFGKTVRPRTLRLEIIPELRKALLLLLSIVKVSPQKKQSIFRGYDRQKQAQDEPYKPFSGTLDLSKSIPIITNREGKELYRYNPDLFYLKTSDKLQDFVSRVLAQQLDVLEILDSDNKQVIRLLDRARRENQAIKGKRQTVKVLLERKVFKSTNVEAKAIAIERDLRKAQKQLKDTQAESIEAIANIVTLINKLRKCSDPNDLERVIRCVLQQYFELYQESVLTTVAYYYQQRAEASSRAPPLELFYSGVLRDKLTELIARLGTIQVKLRTKQPPLQANRQRIATQTVQPKNVQRQSVEGQQRKLLASQIQLTAALSRRRSSDIGQALPPPPSLLLIRRRLLYLGLLAASTRLAYSTASRYNKIIVFLLNLQQGKLSKDQVTYVEQKERIKRYLRYEARFY